MLIQHLSRSRSAIARAARQSVTSSSRRTLFVPTAVRQADLVQDMYLSELRKYKPTPIKPSDAEGHVQKFAAPKAPQTPEESNIAGDLKAYEEQQVELEGQVETGGASAKEEDWFEEEEEEEAAPAH
ncbi:MAG: hypothetical protein M1817_003030 [Caeruleum heppii]|nr:MAG: hypothetical protein M1817_003030 [Caeruleum heppii]